jgi:hypothetical protein
MELSQYHLHLAIERQRRIARIDMSDNRHHHKLRHPRWR